MFKMIHKISKVLLLAFLIFSIITTLFVRNNVVADNFHFMIASTLIFVLLVWVDMFKVLGIAKAVWFILISVLISFVSEFLGVNGTSIFGGTYHYNTAMGLSVGGVPLVVIAMWTAVVYICYRIAVIISEKKEKFRNGYEMFLEYLIIALVAGLSAVSWDLVWDPLAVQINSWAWHITSPYFGIPLQNFTGWIIVVFLSCLIFESTTKNNKKESKDIVIPFLGYLYLLTSTSILALRLSEPHFFLLAFILMAPYLLIIVLAKLRKK